MLPVELVVTLLAFSFAMGQKVPASQYSNPVWGSNTTSPFLQIRESKGFKNLPSKSSGWENRQLTGSSVSPKVIKQLQRGISTTFSECFLLPDSLRNFIFKIHHLSKNFAAGNSISKNEIVPSCLEDPNYSDIEKQPCISAQMLNFREGVSRHNILSS